ncbi:PD-(D/E)XK nuclease-like domain-containing protein [Paraferrimonas sedimenticola]|uniref:PD-(D/E)XK nuclease-like domain-containing protein n=1 Tax=Paraferrimonas sedimenticola TaxID=375674 RepID=UPI001473558E|nr:PD-(D/E)XK nuclease-like domain-containing protein [Paraferrimonas sedimenticola]
MTNVYRAVFEPLKKAPSNVITISYSSIEANGQSDAQQKARALLTREGVNPAHYKKVKITQQRSLELDANPLTEEPDNAKSAGTGNVPTAEPAEEPTQEDLIQAEIATLNERLAKLGPGESFYIDGLNDEVYHGCDGVSCSKLKLFIDCQAKYKAKYIDGLIPPPEKAYFDFGKAVHALLLEPHRMDTDFVLQPETIKVRRGKAWDEFKAEADANFQIVLNQKQWDDLKLVCRSIESCEQAQAMVSGGVAERSYFKRDAETDLIVKVRPDYQNEGLLIDVKTSDSANPRFVKPKFKKLGYHIQDAMYLDVSGAEEFAFLVIESSAPFVITPRVEMENPVRRLGYLKYRKAMRELAWALTVDDWATYTDPAECVVIGLTEYEERELAALESQIAA